jgi:GNAT superfamily N-acetyltransferase
MTPADLPEVERIAEVVHVDLPERAEVLAERLRLFPPGCLMTSGGYAIAHPCRTGLPPALDTLLGALPDGTDALHLHDVALLPALRGQGLGGAAVGRFMQVAAECGLARVGLVAVHGTAPYWARFGFREAAAAVSSYGADARYMVRAAPPSPRPWSASPSKPASAGEGEAKMLASLSRTAGEGGA